MWNSPVRLERENCTSKSALQRATAFAPNRIARPVRQGPSAAFNGQSPSAGTLLQQLNEVIEVRTMGGLMLNHWHTIRRPISFVEQS